MHIMGGVIDGLNRDEDGRVFRVRFIVADHPNSGRGEPVEAQLLPSERARLTALAEADPEPNMIRTLRIAKGWSQRELARRVGCEWQTISRWETGTVVPMADNAIRLAAALECDIDALGVSFYGARPHAGERKPPRQRPKRWAAGEATPGGSIVHAVAVAATPATTVTVTCPRHPGAFLDRVGEGFGFTCGCQVVDAVDG